LNLEIAIGFLLVMIIIGILKKGKNPDILSYYVSGRSKSVLSVSGSLVATAIGGSATVGLSGIAFSKGIPAMWWLFSGSIALILLGFLWAGRIREYEVYTLPEVLEKQYDSSLVKIISSLVIVVAWTGIIASQMIASGKIMTVILPGHYKFFIVLCASVFILYTMFGGQDSVIRTDLFQSFLILSGIILVVVFAYIKHGPLSSELLPAGHLNFPVNQKLGYLEVLMFFMFVGSSFIAGPDMYSRILSAENKRSAQKSVFIAALVIAFFSILIVIIGLYAKMISPAIEPESSFLFVVINSIPATLQGVVFAALLAAFLSSADTCLLTSGIILTNDLINPVIFRNKLSEKLKLSITRIMIILSGLCSLIIALYVNGIIKSLLFALTVYTAGIVLPVILGFYREKFKLNQYGAIAGIVFGGSAAIVLKLLILDQLLVYIFPAALIIIILTSRITSD